MFTRVAELEIISNKCAAQYLYIYIYIYIYYNTAARVLTDIYVQLPRVRIYQSNLEQAVL